LILLNLTTGKPAKARQSAAKAIEIAPDSTDSQMLVAYTERDPIASRHAFLNALAFTPNLPEAYALRGLQTTNTTDSRKFETANALVEYAYKLDPKNSYALMAKAICLLAQKRSLEAQPVVLSLLEVDPTAADSHIVAAILYTQLDKTIKVTEHMKKANSIDPERWGDLFVPKPEAFGTRVLKYRFSPLLSPALLYLTAKEQ